MFGPLGDLNSSLDPRGQRHESWRWDNISRRHISWRRGAWPCTVGNSRWRWRGRYLGDRIHGAELSTVDLGTELGAMYCGTEHAFCAHVNVGICAHVAICSRTSGHVGLLFISSSCEIACNYSIEQQETRSQASIEFFYDVHSWRTWFPDLFLPRWAA